MANDKDDLFTLPEDVSAGIKLEDIEGHLVIMRATGEMTKIDTKIGPSEYLPAEVLDLDDPENAGVWQEIWIFSTGVGSQLKASQRQKKPIVGVIGKGEAKPGNNAPWLVLDPDAAQVKRAREAFVKADAPF
jgi:hypothetical protein